MAVINVIPTVVGQNENGGEVTLTAITSTTDGAVIDFKGQDSKIVVLIKNNGAAAQTATIKKGDSIHGVADYAVNIAAGKTFAYSLESGKFKNVTGANKGKVIILGSTTDIQVGAILLP